MQILQISFVFTCKSSRPSLAIDMILFLLIVVTERDPKFGREDVLRDRYLTDEEEELPAYRLFKKGSLTPVPFRPVEQSVEEFKRFLRKGMRGRGGCAL